MVKAVRSKVERLYKVNIKFGEQDACGQWVHIQGDLIDRRNAKVISCVTYILFQDLVHEGTVWS